MNKIYLHITPDDFPADWSFLEIALYSLIDGLDTEMSDCYASIPVMARLCRTSESTIRRMLKSFVERGIIEIEHRTGTTNIIRICGKNKKQSATATTPTPPRAPAPSAAKEHKQQDHAAFEVPDPEMKKAWEHWLQHKRERKEFYKPTGIKAAYQKLVRFSKKDPAVAWDIIDSAVSNNYQGFFEPKTTFQKTNGFMRGDVPL